MMNQTGAKEKTQIRNHSGNFIVRRILDVGMTAAIVILLGFQITGQEAHEWTGITMTLLVVAHTVLNRSWYTGMVR